jgi:large subunit ribosomal protein L25
VSLDTREFDLLRRRVGPNALVDLKVDGNKASPVLIHGVQVHPVNRRPLHVDLFLVRMTEELTVDVRLATTGSSEAVNTLGGTLIHPTESVRVRALPDHLPQVIEYSIDGLVDFDASVHVRDLTIPEDVTLLTDPEEVIAKVLPPRIEVEEVPEVPEEEAEAAEAAEGEEAAAAAGPSGEAGGERGEGGSEE